MFGLFTSSFSLFGGIPNGAFGGSTGNGAPRSSINIFYKKFNCDPNDN